MSDESPPSAIAPRAVFLSYASQDIAAALRICVALRAAGIEVWFDQNELGGGDGWDRKIRGQIAVCALFVPVISAATQARLEGYFRLEWKLAAQRTHTMADAKPFLLPVVIDGTRDAEAHVPEEFRAVQWTRLPEGQTSPAFCARVQKLLEPAESVVGARLVRAQEDGRGQATPLQKRPRPWRVPALIALAAAVALAFWQPWKSRTPPLPSSPVAAIASEPKPAPAAPLSADQKSIAVLAFADMSVDRDAEYFSDGISEEILNALDRIPALRVTPRTSSFSFKGKNVALDEIGRALRVASVIEGSVRKAGNRVKITVKLLNAADSSRVWSEEFDRELTPTLIFAVQAEIAAKVAQKLGGFSTALAAVPAGAQTKNLAAYDAYLRGRAAQLAATISVPAVSLFDEAVGLDPNYALAWARLAQALDRLRLTTANRTEENARRARDAAATAIRLSPDLPEAHLAVAATEKDFDAIQRALDTVERLRPGDAELLAARANLAYARGNWGAEFSPLVLRAVERDPQNHGTRALLGRALSNAGWFSVAEPLLVASQSLPTESAPATLRSASALVQNTLRWTGNIETALSQLEGIPQEARNAHFFSMRAGLHVAAGNFGAAVADCDRVGSILDLPTGGAAHRNPQNYSLGLIEQKLGREERAKELFARTLAVAKSMEGDPLRFYVLIPALVKARLGHHTEALAAVVAAPQPNPEALVRAFSLQTKAEVLAVVGRSDDAIAMLRTVHEMGYGFGYSLRLDLEWEPLRGNLKFQQLMKEAEARADAQPRPKK